MKKYSNIFLALWMEYDQEFWSEMRSIERQFLLGLLVHGQTIEDLSIKHNVSKEKIDRIFAAILIRVERNLGRDIAGAIFQEYQFMRINRPVSIEKFKGQTICLN